MTYAQIKQYFYDNFGEDHDGLPYTLQNGKYKHYGNVPKNVTDQFEIIENEIQRQKQDNEKPHSTKQIERSLSFLRDLIEDLKEIDGWNQPVPMRVKFNNEN